MSQETICHFLRVRPTIDLSWEVEARVSFLQDRLLLSGCRALVLGISGGVDSSVAGRICQLAVDGLGSEYEFVAVRLPYGEQKDENDAQRALGFIKPSRTVVVNIKESVDHLHHSTLEAVQHKSSNVDFIKGNVKARSRMVVQYEVAALCQGLVVGTDHAAENVVGFFTKWGDGACDLAPLFGLDKRQVRAIGRHLGAPDVLVDKPPTADLEDFQPLLPDETALGLTYDKIDDFLEGRPVDAVVTQKLCEAFQRTGHKREPVPYPHVVYKDEDQ
ncbi:MAG: uncharacterized protein KVP18_002354 [Porospora cf. gigantea A]|uniref:uncharacterized protein n=1 Tax=Porospora cf. gigantea A TaxID=2853593 RepID=UPI0035599371|nr:MAG: hypothetical protein KVP18_002354 [Porospora cf. gigantea A]